jgi:recombination protein RecA
LKEHPETAAKIERAIRQNAGLIAEQILEGEPAEEGAAAADAADTAEGEGTVTSISGGRRSKRGA